MTDLQLEEFSPQAAHGFVSARGVVACEWLQAARFLGCHERGVPRAVLALGPVLALRYDSAASAKALLTLVPELHPDWRELRCAGSQAPGFLERWSPPRARLACIHRLTSSRLALAAHPITGTDCRPAQREDLPRVLRLAVGAAVERQGVEPTLSDLTQLHADVLASIERGEEYVMEWEGQLVFNATALEAAPDLVLVENVFTEPAFRGQGLGSWGIHRLCETLLQQWPRLLVEVEDDNLRAGRLYQRMGFGHADTLWCLTRPPGA